MPCLHGVFELRQAPGKACGACFRRKAAWRKARERLLPGDKAQGRPENILTLFFSCPLYYHALTLILVVRNIHSPCDNVVYLPVYLSCVSLL
jgi:hypothetical protein